MQTVLVTGGGGYIGRELCSRLITEAAGLGVKEVRAFDVKQIPSQGATRQEGETGRRYSLRSSGSTTSAAKFVVIEGSVTDAKAVVEACQGVDVVFHLASYGMSGREMMNRRETYRVNVDGTRVVLDACLACGVRRLVYVSTYNVVFGGQKIVNGDESLAYFPLWRHTDTYSASKAVAEQMVLKANAAQHTFEGEKRRRLYTVALRPAAIFGEKEQRHIPRIARYIHDGLFTFTIGDPSNKVDWVYIENLVDALLLAALSLGSDFTADKPPNASGKAYFISDGQPVNQFEFLRPLVEALDKPFPTLNVSTTLMYYVAWLLELFHWWFSVIWDHEPLLTRAEVYKTSVHHTFSITRAVEELGYHPKVSSLEGMRRVAKYYKESWQSIRESTAPSSLRRRGDRGEEALVVKSPSLLWWVSVLGGMGALGLSAFDVEVMDLELEPWMGLVREVGMAIFGSQENLQMLFAAACSTHLLEAWVAVVYAWRGGYSYLQIMVWLIQTSLLGYPSLALVTSSRSKKRQQPASTSAVVWLSTFIGLATMLIQARERGWFFHLSEGVLVH